MPEFIKTAIAGFTLRAAEENDAELIWRYIQELILSEGLSGTISATPEILRESIFGRGAAEAIIAEYEGEPVGMALYYQSFAGFTGLPNIYLEDFYIREEYRSRGFGREVMKYLARLVKERECGRLEWAVLNDNTRGIKFYNGIGAEAADFLTLYRMKGEALDKLAEE